MLRLGPVSITAHAAVIALSLLIYVHLTRSGREHRQPSAAIAWVVGLVAFPYLVLPLFLLLGRRKLARPPRSPRSSPPAKPPPSLCDARWALDIGAALGLKPASPQRLVRFDADGAEALRSFVDLCASARERLDISTFVLGRDPGSPALAAIVAARRRGVACRLLVDGIGSWSTPWGMIRRLRKEGIEVRHFMPLLHDPRGGQSNLRNHRKLALADGRRLWSGGRNLADEYFEGAPGAAPGSAWVDLSFTVEGPIAAQAQLQFLGDWDRAHGRPWGWQGRAMWQAPAGDGQDVGPWLQWVPTGPDTPDDNVQALMLAAGWQARREIVAVTPYFVPDDALVGAWCLACRRGVQLTLIVPAKSNHRLADIARERSLRRLVHAGAQVRLLPHMLHAKAVLVDDAVAWAGSANLDCRSLMLNHEVMVAFYSPAEIDWLRGWMLALAARGRLHEGAEPGLLRDVGEGMVRSVAFQL